MLRLLTEQLRIVITPAQIGVMRIVMGRPQGEIKTYPLEKAASIEDAIATAFATIKSDFSNHKGVKAGVILSGHFARYLVLSWQEALSSDDEWLTYASHAMRGAYGSSADHWKISLSRHTFGTPLIAAAIESSIHKAISSAVEATGLKLVWMQPYFTRAFNRHRQKLRSRDFWLMSVEDGCQTIGRVNQDHWSSLISLKHNANSDVPLILLREMSKYAENLANQTLYVQAPKTIVKDLTESLRDKTKVISLADGDFPGPSGEMRRLALC